MLNWLKKKAGFAASRSARQTAAKAADRLIASGVEAEKAGNLREACLRYREAVAAAPGYAAAHLNLGIGLEASGDAAASASDVNTVGTPNLCAVSRAASGLMSYRPATGRLRRR